MSIQENNQNYHQQLQERLLFMCNSFFLSVSVLLGIASFFSGAIDKMILAVLVAIVLGCSIFLLKSEQYISSSYITSLGLILACYGILIAQNPRNNLAIYEFVSFASLPLINAGFLAKNRSFTIIITGITMGLLSYYIFAVQIPLIGFTHKLYIINTYVILFTLGLLSDQIFLLTGNIFNKYIFENRTVLVQKKKIDNITSIYKHNKQ
ncbi:MAG: hypothetical protein ACRCV0_04155, partial [Brevinema sp.]